ncbi:MAG: FAD-dependent oxidoreductase [Bryobacteraceae bacterium]|jgi:glycine oxidase
MIAIVGAGLIGTSIAWRLSQSGLAATLFERGKLGGETSSAGAGMLSPGGEFDSHNRWLHLGLKGIRLFPAFVEELRSETGIPIDFQICGSVYFAEPSVASARAEFQSSVGIRVEVTPEGLVYPDDAFVDPSDLLRALRCACERRGVKILENHPVSEIETADYDAVVIAAGAWSGGIRIQHQGRAVEIPETKPVKGHLIGFQMEPGALGRIRRWGHAYVLQRSNGFTIAGSNEEDAGFDRTVDVNTCEEIHQHAAELFPDLRDLTPSDRWVGFRPKLIESSGPEIRRVDRTNVWLAYGHYRNGILLAPLTAKLIADQIIAGQTAP